MKRILICLLTFVLLFSFSGCGAKEKLEEKVAEKVFEEALGGDLDIDGDKFTITGKDGETVTFGDTKWPTSELVSIIPEFKDGTISGVMEYPDSVVISVESVKSEDVYSYFESIKRDFSRDVFEINSSDSITLTGNNDAGFNVTLVCIDEVLTISVSAPIQ